MWAMELSGARCEDRQGKKGCRCAVAGLTAGGEQTVRRVASLCRDSSLSLSLRYQEGDGGQAGLDGQDADGG